MSGYLGCGCYTHPDGGLTRCPRHDVDVELDMAMESLYRECAGEYSRPESACRSTKETGPQDH